MTDYRDKLREIRTFPSLVKFLRDDLDWPIEGTDDFEDLTFDYTPEELGIDAANAAKIEEIKRLRPLVANQPWGIFFVKFEPKQLPVVALRRILNGVVVKNRATPSAAEQKKWPTHDLLFISNYGEDDERRISFAHFSRDPAKKDLPTLKVLAWDDLDTPLHLEHAANTLVEKLSWPASDEWDGERWRGRWSSAFELRHREVITSSKVLAERLAVLARAIRDRIKTVLAVETEDGPVTKLMKAFQEALIHDLDVDGFADMYAQTVAYGLLSARVTNPKAEGPDGFAEQLPVTNPFLKELMETFLHGGRGDKPGGTSVDFDELGVTEVVQLLDDANMEAIVRDFGDRNPEEDPVIHFYEHFLAAYDKKQKAQRGVFYTPRPVVSHIVRSVDELLQAEFALPDGLADTTTWGEMASRHKDLEVPERFNSDHAFVQILDPATGTGTFLVEVIDVIHKTLIAKWLSEGHNEENIEALWNEYVPKHLLPRLHGYELLMAPYAIAHLKVGLKLYETGYRFASDERARIYLTNALEPPHDFSGQLAFAIPALAHEAQEVNEIKRTQQFTVVMANPPYSNLSANLTRESRALVEPYKFVNGERIRERGALSLEKNINDDYVKFVRLAELTVGRSGVYGLVTNNGFLTNPTLRGLRWSLLSSFTRMDVLNLLGYAGPSTRSSLSTRDENVFDIANAGVAVHFGYSPIESERRVRYAELEGSRQEKYSFLLRSTVLSTDGAILSPEPPFFLMEPLDSDLKDEYETFTPLLALFGLNSTGIRTLRDSFVVDFEEDAILERVQTFRDSKATDEQLCAQLGLEMPKWWKIASSRKSLSQERDLRKYMRPFAYRPFDQRKLFYHDSLVGSPRRPVMQHMEAIKRNLGLHVCRQLSSPAWCHILVTRGLTDDCYVSNRTKERGYTVPLYLSLDGSQGGLSIGTSTPNFNADVLRRFAVSNGDDVEPEQIFKYVYAVLFCPTYRTRYLGFLKRDFPRVPPPRDREMFENLARLGDELVGLHLLELPRVNDFITSYVGPRHPEVGRIAWSDETVWLNGVPSMSKAGSASTMGFHGVSEVVWNFEIGAYRVCHKWLKDRRGRTLSDDDIAHYQKIVVAISETIRLMREIDEVIETHGGWPDAFAASAKEAVA